MNDYVVITTELKTQPVSLADVLLFTCKADDVSHAREQCHSACPESQVLAVCQGEHIDESLRAYITNNLLENA